MKAKSPVHGKHIRIIKGSYHPMKDWIEDKTGYFLIRVKKKNIELAYCKKDNIIEVIIEGKTPQEIYFVAAKEKLLSRLDHASYLGKELEKAYLALKNNLDYVQDE